MVGAIQGGSSMSTEMLAQMRERMFSKLDTDGDGQIDLTELQAQAAQSGNTDNRFTDMFERLSAADTNGDGMVSKAEFEAMKMPEPPRDQGPESRLEELSSARLYAADGEAQEEQVLTGLLIDTAG